MEKMIVIRTVLLVRDWSLSGNDDLAYREMGDQ